MMQRHRQIDRNKESKKLNHTNRHFLILFHQVSCKVHAQLDNMAITNDQINTSTRL